MSPYPPMEQTDTSPVTFYYDNRANRLRGGWVLIIRQGDFVERTDLLCAHHELELATERAREQVAKFPNLDYYE